MRGFMLCALLVCLSVGCQSNLAFQDTGLPKPPAWTPPQTKLGTDVVSAVQFLLQHGFGDPRPGKLSVVTITSGSAWDGGGKPVETFGWVLPAKEGKPRMVVAPDGLVYEALSVGAETTAKSFLTAPQQPYLGWNPYGAKISLAATLLLAGEVEEAEKMMQASQRSGSKPFIDLANSYLTARFHRAVEAHMRGDDALALADAQALALVRDGFEAEAMRILGNEEVKRRSEYNPGQKIMVFSFLDPLDALLEDSKRRLQEGPKKPLDLKAIKGLPQPERVAKLIEGLDPVNARQWGQPGGVSLGSDPIVGALAEEGEAAIELLIDVLEKDTRLTRSASFGRDFFPTRNLITVKSAATVAIGMIYQTNVFIEKNGEIDIPALRSYAAKNKGLTPAERWYGVLQDDTAGRDKWLSAATQLVETPGVRHLDGWVTTPQKGDTGMKVEPLRGRVPSISSLMDKRARQIVEQGERNSSLYSHELSEALQIGLHLYKWDPKAALPTLQSVSKEIERPHGQLDVYVFQNCAMHLGEATLALAKLGDKEAVGAYGDWIAKLKVEWGGRETARAFTPIAVQPDDPQMAALANRLFTDPASPWNLVAASKEENGSYKVEGIVFSPLLTSKAVVSSVEEILKDKTVIGKTWRSRDSVNYSILGPNGSERGGGGMGLPNDGKEDPLAPKEDVKVDLRFCDKLAGTLGRIKGIPFFRPY